jgi:hypothetical protein
LAAMLLIHIVVSSQIKTGHANIALQALNVVCLRLGLACADVTCAPAMAGAGSVSAAASWGRTTESWSTDVDANLSEDKQRQQVANLPIPSPHCILNVCFALGNCCPFYCLLGAYACCFCFLGAFAHCSIHGVFCSLYFLHGVFCCYIPYFRAFARCITYVGSFASVFHI